MATSAHNLSPSTSTAATPIPTKPTPLWHLRDAEQVIQEQRSNAEQGLSQAEAAARLAQFGPNELVERGNKTIFSIFKDQISNPLVLLLIGAATISGFLGKWDSLIAISAIVILNIVLGVVQEFRAERAMAALKRMSAPTVRVRRDGKLLDVDGRQVVPGDIVLLEAGSVVPSDGRLIESANLRVQETSLTGESHPVEKSAATLSDANAPLGDRHNMVYMGTNVTYGRGTAVIVATGMQTQLGRIAELIQTVEGKQTPLGRRLEELGRVLLYGALAVMAIAFIIGLVMGVPIIPTSDSSDESVLLNAVAIAVAVVPEGLPAVVTIALALGAQRMLRRRALIRKLNAVETLGSVTVICSDKTGTLTENKMTAVLVDVADAREELSHDSSAPLDPHLLTTAGAITVIGSALCNDAVLQPKADSEGELETVGDPTEGALVMAAARYGLYKRGLERLLRRVGEVPFESDRKRMSTIHHCEATVQPAAFEQELIDALGLGKDDFITFTKGAVDSLLSVCRHAWVKDRVVPLTEAEAARITATNEALAQDGLRVLGLAYRISPDLPPKLDAQTVEQDLVFVGMIGIIDPPRREVRDAVATSIGAGVRPIMITGDHPLTAMAIAKELGIAKDGDRAMTGHELSRLSEEELREVVKTVNIYARVSPENKLSIVNAIQKNGEVAAMTGDGVNDAPALKRANIGVAMGITGTAVSKEASDMVLLDDNFATIVAATEEGRTIYDNVRRFIKYLLASNTGELFVLLACQLIAVLGLPLTTLQILWMNLVTDGIPALALGVERAERGVMRRRPYRPEESLFGRGLGRHIVIVGLTMGATGVLLGLWAKQQYLSGAPGYVSNTWNTMLFFFLTIAQMGHALGLRSHRESLFSLPFFSNPALLAAVAVTVIVQTLAIYLPFFNNLFNTTPLTLEQLLICAVLSTVVFIAVEVEKVFIRRGLLDAKYDA
ncbi:MAG: cation-translocating P-type ATPase [Anaerolineae bacterium]|nr:cation-translocating P-type ATPase [Anaerolineae bacterium]MDW8171824.1 cation-translocating P-type ATPase [Anaerolineae bacterium]